MPDGAAIERVEGRALDGRSDVSSAGICVYKLLTGTHTLSFVNPDLPPQKRTVVVRAGEETRLTLDLK